MEEKIFTLIMERDPMRHRAYDEYERDRDAFAREIRSLEERAGTVE